MCEFLVNLADQASGDPVQDAALPKRGDVIAIQADGHAWGQGETGHPDWGILRWPGVDPAAYAHLLVPEAPQRAGQKLIQYRQYHLTSGREVLRRPPLEDPDVIG